MDNSALKGVIAKFTLNGDTKNSFNNLLFNKYQEIQKNGFCLDSKGNLWIASSDGLLKFNTNEQIHYKNNFPVFIKQVTLKNDSSFSLIRGFIPDVLKKQLPFELNDISFRFSAANYSGVNDLYFSSRLLPLEDNFGEWTLLRNKNYSYLPEGKYTLEVKAKDIFNNYSNIKRFTFDIAPPWYRTKLAYFLYFVLAIALIYGLIKFNTIRLRAVNDLLEKTVKERTHELWEERDKLSEANLEITDSINYAKIIQQSILPDVKTFKKTFTDSFILFKPRNIVSGDFYWFSLAGVNNKTKYNLSQHIIVAADCTGHGVPGAFMSMIGSEKLNQSIAEIEDLTPSNMLSFMNRKIKDSLKQEEGNSQSKDGMEISLCFLDTDTNILTFAGANRPLWIYRKDCTLDSVEIIKPTKAGIAGHTSADQVFAETEIQLYKGDTIYLFTDGAPDQFGGAKNKKLTTKGLRQLLFDIQSQSMEQQGKSINGFYRSWMGNTNEQVDDILIMGIRI
jgi:serine phosphatase RsbU (regulator of sigma subunit)